MTDTPVLAPVRARPLRADAQRNRDALVATAVAAFHDEGTDVPLEEIARRAGVGIGTLYRHFPTREALLAACYLHDVEVLCAEVDPLLAAQPADAALELWMQKFVDHVALKRGMADAIKASVGKDNEAFARSHALLVSSLGRLTSAGEEAGLLRSDLDPLDLLRAIGGVCSVNATEGWEERARRLVSLMVDGLRYRAG